MANSLKYSPLGDLIESHDARRRPVKSSERNSGPYPYYGASGIVDYVDAFLFDGEFLLVAEDGENLRTRQTPIAFMAKGQFWVNNHAHIMRGNERADTRFLMYALCVADVAAYLSGSTMPKLTKGNLDRIPIPDFPLDEQRRIAHILGALDDKIELNRQLNATLEQLARSLYQSWFVDFGPVRAKASGEPEESICHRLGLTPELLALFPATFQSSAMGEIPAGWKITSIGEAVDVVGGGTPSTAIDDYWHKGIYHWATPKDLSGLNSPILLDTDRKITEKGVRNISSGLLPRDTVLLSSRAPVGYLAISAIPIAINQGFIALRCNGPVAPYYAYMWCLDNMAAIKSRASGTTFLEISKKSFRPMPVLIPDKQIMVEFTALVELLFNQIEEGAKEAVTLASLRDELLPKLLSGQITIS